jgi:hypothetical protein
MTKRWSLGTGAEKHKIYDFFSVLYGNFVLNYTDFQPKDFPVENMSRSVLLMTLRAPTVAQPKAPTFQLKKRSECR